MSPNEGAYPHSESPQARRIRNLVAADILRGRLLRLAQDDNAEVVRALSAIIRMRRFAQNVYVRELAWSCHSEARRPKNPRGMGNSVEKWGILSF